MSDGDSREHTDLHPRFGGRDGEAPQERVPRFRSPSLARVTRIGATSGGRHHLRGGRPQCDGRPPGPMARRWVVKARLVPTNTYRNRATALQLTYIEGGGAEQYGTVGRVDGRPKRRMHWPR